MSLKELIIEEIKQRGPISFRDYMEMCLYHPLHGFYSSGNSKVGPRGDFYTSPALGSLFGTLIANQLEEMWVLLGKKDFVIVEYGAGTGLLCHDILTAIAKKPDFYHSVHYFIIEKNNSIAWRFATDIHVTRINSLNDLPAFEGCILSNELIDNFSVHRVFNQEILMEVCVDYESGQFRETMLPAGKNLCSYFSELGVTLPKGFHTEVNLEAIDWIREISSHLQSGFFALTFGVMALILPPSSFTSLCVPMILCAYVVKLQAKSSKEKKRKGVGQSLTMCSFVFYVSMW